MKKTDFAAALLTTSADEAVAALKTVPDAEALIAAWSEAQNAGAIQEIAECGAGNARKAARRALNVLKARGIQPPPRSRIAKLAENTESAPVAWLLPPDGAGFLLLAVARELAGGACRAAIVTLNDQMGVFRVENVDTTPSKLAHSLAQALPGLGLTGVSVPLDWARYKIANARAVHTSRKTPEPMGLMSAKSLLEPLPDVTPEHPFEAEGFVFSQEDAADLAKDSGALHQLPEFRTWLPSQGSMDGLLAEVGKQLQPDASTPDQVGELLKQGMLDAADRYFTMPVREELAARMRDAAISVLAREGEASALKVAAAIQVVASHDSILPRDVPFLGAFFEKAVSVLMAQSGGKLNIPVPRSQPAVGQPAPAAL
jgi:hypothetical protein